MTESHAERHERERFAWSKLSEPDKMRQQLYWKSLYASNPWKFLVDCVYTLDQVSSDEAIRPFPTDLEYLEFLTVLWQREKLIAVPKSRRMVCSWLFISLYTQDTIFRTGRFNGFVSKKEDDSGALIERAEFIYNKIPEWRIPRALLPALKNGKMSKQPPVMEFPDLNSKLQGFPMGADQLRSHTFSNLFFDEWAFWEQAQKAYSSAKPTLDGGGGLTGVSSRSPGFFKKIVFDKLDSQDLNFREEPPVRTKSPLEGVEVWKNPRNKFCVVDLHYTANPAKRGDAWREAVRSSMPARDFAMEYEKSWQTYEGRAVYEDFNKSLHVLRGTISAEPGIPLLLGWDFGLTPACIVAQLVGSELRILHEFIEGNGSISKLAPAVWSFLNVRYRNWTAYEDKIFSLIDPAGFQRAQTDERTCADVLRKEGFRNIQPGPVDWEARRSAVEQFLVKLERGKACMQISDVGAPVLIAGFAGGYRYPEKALEIEPAQIRPVKDQYSHPHDALQYLCWGANQKRKSYKLTMPTPAYGFQGAQTHG